MKQDFLRYLRFLLVFFALSSAISASDKASIPQNSLLDDFSAKPALYLARSQKNSRFAVEQDSGQNPTVSRAVTIAEKQRVEIAYPGQGWVYIGEQSSQQGIRYEQRKLSDNATVFTFTGEKKGAYILHFSYFDVFTDDFITDSIAVTVGSAKDRLAKTLVKAPEYKTARTDDSQNAGAAIAAESAAVAENIPAPAAGTPTPSAPAAPLLSEQPLPAAVPQNTATAGKNTEKAVPRNAAEAEDLSELEPAVLLQKAREATDAANAPAALRYLAAFFDSAEENIDEALFLQGRVYELNTADRNIRSALEAYKTLTMEYPQSVHWAAADSRIRYITAFYINIR